MKKFIFMVVIGLSMFSTGQAQNKFNLPDGALIVETQAVNPGREMVLWMTEPKKVPHQDGGFYSCPDETRGSYYEGKTHVSLIDTKTQNIVNTVEVSDDGYSDGLLDIPYLIERHFYEVPSVDSKGEGKPQIMALKDYNGDGKAEEFALFDREACQGVATTLIGYDEKKDNVVQYSVQLNDNGKEETVHWVDELFFKRSISAGLWKYQIDYRGRGGTLDNYEIRYDRGTESFRGMVISTGGGSK